jgi:hypothetical protein
MSPRWGKVRPAWSFSRSVVVVVSGAFLSERLPPARAAAPVRCPQRLVVPVGTAATVAQLMR